MSEKHSKQSDELTTSTGHACSEANWLDQHFAAAQPEYEALLRSVGIEKGWQVLDAGCGGGSFIPLMSELVGKDGYIAALDMAPENIVRLEARVENKEFMCPVFPQVGTVTSLPYIDNRFDAVWCANVSMYLTDEEMTTMLSEFLRVTRSGGLIAIKETDITLMQAYPTDRTFFQRVWEHIRKNNQLGQGLARTINLRNWLAKAGLVNVQYKTTIMERFAPLRPAERSFIIGMIMFDVGLGLSCGVPEPDLTICRTLSDSNNVNYMIDQPDYYFREGYGLVIGRVP